MESIKQIFASMVFNDAVMREKLPKDTYKSLIKTIEDGVMTGDLYLLSTLENKQKVNTEDFLKAVDERLKALLA